MITPKAQAGKSQAILYNNTTLFDDTVVLFDDTIAYFGGIEGGQGNSPTAFIENASSSSKIDSMKPQGAAQ